MGIRAWAAFRWTFYRVHSILFAHNNISGRVTCDSRLLCDVPVPGRDVLCMYGAAFFLNYVTVSGQDIFFRVTSIKIRSLIAYCHGHFFEAQSRLSVDL